MSDFDDAVPASVQRQAERSEELMKQMQDEDPPRRRDDTPMYPTEAYSEPPTNEPEQETPSQESPQDGFEHKYKVLQGKYNAEMPRLQNQVSELYQHLSRLQQENEQLKTQSKESEIPKMPEYEEIDPESLTEYGDEFGKMAKQLNTLAQENRQLQDELKSIKDSTQKVQQTQHSSREEQFWDRLSNLVPNWDEVNQNQDFLNWLTEEDPVSGTVRQQILEHHRNNLDVNKVARVFKAWLDQSGQSVKKQDTQLSGESKPKKEGPKNVQPEASRAEEPEEISQGRTWTRAQIKRHYDDMARGAWENREDEWKKIERQMLQAVQEGRVQ